MCKPKNLSVVLGAIGAVTAGLATAAILVYKKKAGCCKGTECQNKLEDNKKKVLNSWESVKEEVTATFDTYSPELKNKFNSAIDTMADKSVEWAEVLSKFLKEMRSKVK